MFAGWTKSTILQQFSTQDKQFMYVLSMLCYFIRPIIRFKCCQILPALWFSYDDHWQESFNGNLGERNAVLLPWVNQALQGNRNNKFILKFNSCIKFMMHSIVLLSNCYHNDIQHRRDSYIFGSIRKPMLEQRRCLLSRWKPLGQTIKRFRCIPLVYYIFIPESLM